MILKRYYDDQGRMTSFDARINNEVRRIEMQLSVKASLELIREAFGNHGECTSDEAKENLEATRPFIDNFRGTL